MDQHNQVKIYLEDEILATVDTYRAELRGKGITTSRSSLISAALIEYVQRRREEAAGEATNAAL